MAKRENYFNFFKNGNCTIENKFLIQARKIVKRKRSGYMDVNFRPTKLKGCAALTVYTFVCIQEMNVELDCEFKKHEINKSDNDTRY